MRNEEMKTTLINSQSDTQGGVHQSYFLIGKSADIIGQYGFWYDSTSIASRLSLSAFLLIISMSLASDLCIGSLPAETGKKRISARPAGTSGGTSMVSLWLAGISTVCEMLIRKM
jgi:hypothetical protein